MSYETDDLPEEEYWLQYRAWSATQESASPIEPLHQPPRDLSAVHPTRDASGRRIDDGRR